MWRFCPFTQCQYHSSVSDFCALANFSYQHRTPLDCQLKKMVSEMQQMPILSLDADKLNAFRFAYGGKQNVTTSVEKKLYKHVFFVQFYRSWLTIPGRKEDEITIESPKKHSFIPDRFNRKITTCVIHPVDSVDFYSDIAVLHPGEDDHPLAGAKQAFIRAVQEMARAENFSYDAFATNFITPLLKKEFSDDSSSDNYIFNNHGFVLHVKLPWEAKHGHR